MRVLVTGNLGYIGPVVVRRLREAGHETVGVDVGWYHGQYAEEPVWPDRQYFGDIREPVDDWFVGIDAVVHLAGLSNDPIGALNPDLTRDINYAGTAGMLRPGPRHLVVSSCSVYGAAEMATEETPVAPQTAYALCKAMVDNYLVQFGRLSGITDYAILRLGTVYGYSPGHRLDLVVNKMVHDAATGHDVTVTGDAARPFVHVEDVASAILFMLDRPEVGIYNVVGENMRIAHLGEMVAEFAGVSIAYGSSADTRDYMASADRFRNLGWKPRHSIAGSLPVLFERSLRLPPDRIYFRLPIAQRNLEGSPK